MPLALRTVPPEVSAKKSAGAPCTHQFIDTLTVQTTKIKPRFTPPTTSAASTTKAHPLVVIPGDVQQLVFANAVIVVEGHGDKLLIDYLLERITGGAGGHYAMGITVIDASSIDNIPHIVRLAQLFGVRAYIITDKDGVRKAGGDGKRKLLEILKTKVPRPTQEELSELRDLADADVYTLKTALEQQAELNAKLAAWDAFVLASDLEGLLLDAIGQSRLAEMLGPDGEKQIDAATAEKFAQGARGKEELASWLGSKGWNTTGKKSGKAKPHLPFVLLREHLSKSRGALPRPLRAIEVWLREIVSDRERSPL